MTPKTNPPGKRVAYTPQELAALLKMSKDTVYRAIAAGEIKAVKLGRLYRIPVSEVERLFGKSDAA
jgi:excisionase family DNA binding protein